MFVNYCGSLVDPRHLWYNTTIIMCGDDQMNEVIPERFELAELDKWAIHDIYEDASAWEADLEKLQRLGAKLPSYAGLISTDSEKLLEYQRLGDEINVLIDSLGNYAHRKSDEDTRDSFYQGMAGKLTKVLVSISTASSFEIPEILSISDETMERFYHEQPALTLYRRVFENIRRKRAHILSEKEERILALSGDFAGSPHQIYSMFNDADLKFAPAADKNGNLHPISQGTYIPCMESADRVLRENAFKNLYAGYGAFKNTVAGMLSAQVKHLEFSAKARNYASSLDASLDETNVPTAVYHNLIASVHDHIDLMHRYVRLRKKLLGVDALHFYDLYTPLVPGPDTKIGFDDAKQTVRDALSCMGDEYLAILDEGFQNRWIDVYENVGKRSGAYSAGARVHPFVLLNYSGTLDSQFTLAHEMGHAIHSYLSNKNQPVCYSDYVIFVAEVASTCNEALLMQNLLGKTKEKKERAYLINHFLEQFRGTLYRQTMFAEFELLIGELNAKGTTLTADVLCDEYRKLNAFYFGPDIVLDDEIAMEWARIPHFYYDYYVFQYATGYAAAIALSDKILNEGKSAVDQYLKFLSGGCSMDPIDLLRIAGVDMATAQPINAALKLFERLLDEMEALMNDE